MGFINVLGTEGCFNADVESKNKRGMTSPFMRKAAVAYTPPKRAFLEDPSIGTVKRVILK